MSPTQLTLKHWRSHGYLCAVVEKYNKFAKVRQDLFGCIDVLAVKDDDMVGIQTTVMASVPARLQKLRLSENALRFISDHRTLIVEGWAKRGARGQRKVWTGRRWKGFELDEAVEFAEMT